MEDRKLLRLLHKDPSAGMEQLMNQYAGLIYSVVKGKLAESCYIHEYLANINRPIDMAKDYCELENVAVYYFGFTDPNKNYLTGSSFVQYLVKQYGEEAVINSIYGNGDPLPKTYAELVKEWNEFIKTNYSNYSKYK